MTNFWRELPSPFFVLAPMDDVTDNVFRKVINDVARPDVFFTEFTNADGMISVGSKIVGRKLVYEKGQHPIVAQIWGNNPENIRKAAGMVKEMGFDGIDFNMSCPVRNIVKRGCGSAIIGNNKLAAEIIAALKEGAKGIPVSIKTRLGLSKNVVEEWASFLLSQNLDAITIHARTASDMSKVPARWPEIGKVVELKNQISPNTIIIGNGDVKSLDQGRSLAKMFGVNGIMIARGVFDNPWIFDPKQKEHSKEEYLGLLFKHFDYYEKENPDPAIRVRRYAALKKFFKMYLKDFDGVSILRQKLMETGNLDEARDLLTQT